MGGGKTARAGAANPSQAISKAGTSSQRARESMTLLPWKSSKHRYERREPSRNISRGTAPPNSPEITGTCRPIYFMGPPTSASPPRRRTTVSRLRSTTILAVRHRGGVAVGGDGQVTLGNVVFKSDAQKIRRLY